MNHSRCTVYRMSTITQRRTAKAIRAYPENIKQLRKVAREVGGDRGIPDHKVLDVLVAHWFRSAPKDRLESGRQALVPGGVA